MTQTTPAPQVWPSLRARDAHALITFLVEAFGFQVATVIDDNGSVPHAELTWPAGGGVMLGSARTDGAAPDPWELQPGTFGAYAVTDDPDAVHARAVARGAESVLAPYDTDYGSRECVLKDPEGNRWSFGTYRGAPRG
jgi:uncharacterized glyoxalase superfamily protein PhnB